MEVFASLNEGYRLNKNMPINPERIQQIIMAIELLVTTGSAIKIISAMITPKDVPTAKPEKITDAD